MTYVNVYQEWDILKENNKDPEQKIEKSTNLNTQRPSFGFLLQQARIRKRLTTTEVANHLHISAKMVSLIENGTETPTEDIAISLRNFLGVFN